MRGRNEGSGTRDTENGKRDKENGMRGKMRNVEESVRKEKYFELQSVLVTGKLSVKNGSK